jgi:hypothetical protein
MDARAAFFLLGISPGASPDAIRTAYRDLVKVWHPDRFPGDARLQAKATERLRELNEAYEVASAYRGGAERPFEDARPAPVDPPAPTTIEVEEDAAPVVRPRRARPRLSFETIWQAAFWATAVGVLAFVVTAPEGFFAREKGRGVGRPRTGHAEARVYTSLPEGEQGEADLVSRVRGTWVVVETGDEAWLPSGTQVDLGGGTLTCRGARPCDATVRPVGSGRLTIRSAGAEPRDVEVSFASTTSMLWLARSTSAPRPARIVLEAQGGPTRAD